jgi:hypothetical protein
MLNNLGVFTVSSLHAYVCARSPSLLSNLLAGKGATQRRSLLFNSNSNEAGDRCTSAMPRHVLLLESSGSTRAAAPMSAHGAAAGSATYLQHSHHQQLGHLHQHPSLQRGSSTSSAPDMSRTSGAGRSVHILLPGNEVIESITSNKLKNTR